MNAAQVETAYIQVKTKGSFTIWHCDWRVAWELPSEKEIECISWGVCGKPEHDPKSIRKRGLDTAYKTQRVDLGKCKSIPDKLAHFWVSVAVEDPPKEVCYWIVPDKDVRHRIRCGATKWLRDGEDDHHRPNSPKSTHCGFAEQDLSGYQGKWSLLGLDLADDGED